MRHLGIFAILLVAAAAAAQTGPVIEIEGTISKVKATLARGMPFIEIDAGSATKRVYLGSMRYLFEHNFNPKAGESVEVVGFTRSNGEIIAKSVSLKDQDKTLQLRSDDGTPLWRRGRYGRGQRGGKGNRQ